MNEDKKEVLIKNAKEYFDAGKDELAKERINPAVVLFFKCLTAVCDLYILKKTGKIPSSHTDRFRILQTSFPEEYDLIDKDFPC